MNRVDFMKQLESLLQNISPAEREEALQYYNEYFNDAGPENEQQVVEALGNPAKVAENIKRDLYGSGYGDVGQTRGSFSERAVVQYHQSASEEQKQEKKLSTGMLVLIVLLCVFASPVILSIGSAVVGAVLSLIVGWFTLIIGFGTGALTLFAVFLALLLAGCVCLVADPFLGMAMVGGGLVCGGIGMLFLMLTAAMAGIATPSVCRWIVSLFQKKKKAENP